MVLPELGVSMRIVLKLFVKAKRNKVCINRNNSTRGKIYSHANHLLGRHLCFTDNAMQYV